MVSSDNRRPGRRVRLSGARASGVRAAASCGPVPCGELDLSVPGAVRPAMFFGDLVVMARGETPDPIPNSAVKTLSADGTAS